MRADQAGKPSFHDVSLAPLITELRYTCGDPAHIWPSMSPVGLAFSSISSFPKALRKAQSRNILTVLRYVGAP
jgi:hypothetical protein